jgi:CRP-like cAMP-binding protein
VGAAGDGDGELGDMVGEMCVFGGAPRGEMAEVTAGSLISELPTAKVVALLCSDPALAFRFAAMLADRAALRAARHVRRARAARGGVDRAGGALRGAVRGGGADREEELDDLGEKVSASSIRGRCRRRRHDQSNKNDLRDSILGMEVMLMVGFSRLLASNGDLPDHNREAARALREALKHYPSSNLPSRILVYFSADLED